MHFIFCIPNIRLRWSLKCQTCFFVLALCLAPAKIAAAPQEQKPGGGRLPEQNVEDALELGNSARRAKRYEEAERAYRLAARLAPVDPRPYEGLGNVYFDMKKLEESARAYRKAQELQAARAGATTTGPRPHRRPLPKSASGSRVFEQYGREASSRLIAAGATRGIDALEPNAPLEGLAYGAQPFFSWGPDNEAKAYHFVLYEGDVYSNPAVRIVFEKDVTANELAYPKDAPALQPGELYSWRAFRVPANNNIEMKAGRTPATFFILSGKDAEELSEALAKANLISPATTADKLRQARLFEEYGVWYDALRLANEVLTTNPNDAQAAAYYDALLSKVNKKQE